MKELSAQINIGIGDNIFFYIFTQKIKHLYSSIKVIHATDALSYWHNNNQQRLKFNNQLGQLIFSDPPYQFTPSPAPRAPFYPNDRIVKELNSIPLKPNLDHLCAGTTLNIKDYIVLTTKVRQFSQTIFEQYKAQLTPALQKLAERYTIVIIGEKIVENTKEYSNSVNIGQVFGIYDYLKSIFPVEKTVDLTVPALGVAVSSIEQFRQDCLILKNAKSVINFGIGGNLWMAIGVAQKVIGLRCDQEWTTDLMHGAWGGLHLTKNIEDFVGQLERL